MVQEWPRDTVPRHQSYSQPRYHTESFDQRRHYDGPENIRHPPMVRDSSSSSCHLVVG